MRKIGVHLPTNGKLLSVFQKADELDITCMQIFTASNRQLAIGYEIDKDIAASFKKKSSYTVISHAGYLLNIASSSDSVFRNAIAGLISEIERCKQLGIDYIVLHPGSNPDFNKAAEQIEKACKEIIPHCSANMKIVLENSAGQGNSIPFTIEQIKIMNNKLHALKKHIGWCIDTCHAHVACADFSDKQAQADFWQELDKAIGISSVDLIHCNDSKKPYNSHVDRHEFLGKGTIGKKGFDYLLNNPLLKHIPLILEVPIDTYVDYKEDLSFIKQNQSN